MYKLKNQQENSVAEGGNRSDLTVVVPSDGGGGRAEVLRRVESEDSSTLMSPYGGVERSPRED